MSHLETRIADNLAHVRSRVTAAAERSGRLPDSVRLVAVTKYVGEAEIRAVLAAGCFDLGESRPQQLWQRAAAFENPSIKWHLIGHLQRNKVERTIPLVSLVHSGDSRRIIEAMSASVMSQSLPRVSFLLEVNISGDPAKHGFAPAELESQLAALAASPGISIRGLMAMAGKPDDEIAARAEFARLRQLRDHLCTNCPDDIRLDELSMGMSGDYEVAIEEGATIVRIGSALFEGLA